MYLYCKIFAGQNICPTQLACIIEIFHGINFHPFGKDHHRFYVLINMRKRICGIKKFRPCEQGGEIGENFQLYGTKGRLSKSVELHRRMFL